MRPSSDDTAAVYQLLSRLKGEISVSSRRERRSDGGAAVHKQLRLITGGRSQHLSLPEAPELSGRGRRLGSASLITCHVCK